MSDVYMETKFQYFHHSPGFVNLKSVRSEGVCLPGCFSYSNKAN